MNIRQMFKQPEKEAFSSDSTGRMLRKQSIWNSSHAEVCFPLSKIFFVCLFLFYYLGINALKIYFNW